jgi:hypothetical protein
MKQDFVNNAKKQERTQAMKTNKRTRQQLEPMLRFSPTAWAKLIFMRDFCDSEVGAFGIAPTDDLLYIEDIKLVKQKVSCVTVAFDDDAVADFFDQQVDEGRKPEQFARCWIHTHPGNSSTPSITDEQTFARVFGGCDWSVMFIIDQNGNTYARMRFGVGPGGQIKLPVAVDYSLSFVGSDMQAWKTEYLQNVKQETLEPTKQQTAACDELLGFEQAFPPSDELLEQIELMDPTERQLLIEELASQSAFWDEEMEAYYD